MNWKNKAAIFRLLEALPAGDQILYLLQKHVTRELPRREAVLDELSVASEKILNFYSTHQQARISEAVFLEIGAGRDLAVALALRMSGVGRVVCVDLSPLAKLGLIQHAANYLAKKFNIATPVFNTWQDVSNFGIDYFAPRYLQDLSVEKNYFDCFYSTDVLEHIPKADLSQVLRAGHALLKKDGLAIHAIDYSDHFARSDSTTSRFNFLTFTNKQWEKYNTSFQYVNRLRHSEYVHMFSECSYRISLVEPTVQLVEEKIVKLLAPEFKKFSLDDLFTLRSWFVCHLKENQ